MNDALLKDPMLAGAPVVHGYRVLDPAVLVRALAEGGMAAVYLGVHLRLRVPVAVKVLKPFPGDASARAAERFTVEAEQAARLSHPNVVRVYDFRSGTGRAANSGGPPYLVMEFVDGETVETRTRRRRRLPPREAAAIAVHAARGLRAAHKDRIVHRDVKPANILVGRSGEVKLTDLGIAKAPPATSVAITQENTLLGTPQYMAPELWRGARNASTASDVYALGATLGFMLLGEHVLGTGTDLAEIMHRTVIEGFPDVRTVAPWVDAALADLVRRSTGKDPTLRPSAADVEAALGQYLLSTGPGEPSLEDPAAGGPGGGVVATTLLSNEVLTAIRRTLDEAEAPRARAGGSAAAMPAAELDTLTRSAPLPAAPVPAQRGKPPAVAFSSVPVGAAPAESVPVEALPFAPPVMSPPPPPRPAAQVPPTRKSPEPLEEVPVAGEWPPRLVGHVKPPAKPSPPPPPPPPARSTPAKPPAARVPAANQTSGTRRAAVGTGPRPRVPIEARVPPSPLRPAGTPRRPGRRWVVRFVALIVLVGIGYTAYGTEIGPWLLRWFRQQLGEAGTPTTQPTTGPATTRAVP